MEYQGSGENFFEWLVSYLTAYRFCSIMCFSKQCRVSKATRNLLFLNQLTANPLLNVG